jgi:hypothetical protein
MKIECTEKRLSTTDRTTGVHFVMEEGDVRTVSDAFGKYLCDRGWARDLAGEYATGERIPGAQVLEVQNARFSLRSLFRRGGK